MCPALRGVCAEVKLAEQYWRRMYRAGQACGVYWSRSRRGGAECLRAPAYRFFLLTAPISQFHSILSLPSTDTMAAAPTKQALTELFNATMRTSREFSSYNFRNYFVRRTKTVFQEIEVRLTVLYHSKCSLLSTCSMNQILHGCLRSITRKPRSLPH